MKGQSFSFDAIIAAIIFVVAIFSFFSFLMFSQATNDYGKDIMDKEMIRVSALLMSEDPDYGIMQSAVSNKILAEMDMDGKITNVAGTSPYRICVQISDPISEMTTYHPLGCSDSMKDSISQIRTARIVIGQSGRAVSMSINIYKAPPSAG
jgi:hypothetical protein